MKIVIVGAGPAGMIAGITLCKNKHEVIILEKNDKPGKKLNITGKGRCNITYVGDKEYFLSNVVSNPKFLMSSISNLDNTALIEYINSLGVKTKEERGNRVFLQNDDASELTYALYNELKRLNCKFKFNSPVESIIAQDDEIKGLILATGEKIYADKILIATGGASYPLTGSTGDGYIFAKQVGHNIIKIKPALVPLKLYEKDICSTLQGVTLKNVELRIELDSKIIDKRFGEMLFTNKGVTGPIVLSSSSRINKLDDLEKLTEYKKIKVIIDLKPALAKEELYKRITRDFEKYKNKEFKNSLNDITISSLIPVIISKTGIDETKKVNSITKKEKEKLVDILKNLTFTLKDLESVNVGIVTSGGIDVKQINPKTMESKIVKGLYFAGEVIDVDAYTGGFNLQIAFSTGYTAALNMGEE